MFIFEAGWRVGVKTGSMRELCYMMAPGQDFYHRLLDGEIFLVRDGERLCLSCALRRGLISFEPKQLREAIVGPADLETMPLSSMARRQAVEWRRLASRLESPPTSQPRDWRPRSDDKSLPRPWSDLVLISPVEIVTIPLGRHQT